MPDFFVPGMRLYLDEMVDWESLLTLNRGDGVDVEAEVAAYRSVLETSAALAESFLPTARENWAELAIGEQTLEASAAKGASQITGDKRTLYKVPGHSITSTSNVCCECHLLAVNFRRKTCCPVGW